MSSLFEQLRNRVVLEREGGSVTPSVRHFYRWLRFNDDIYVTLLLVSLLGVKHGIGRTHHLPLVPQPGVINFIRSVRLLYRQWLGGRTHPYC
jgi:hypothetical protein